MNRSTAANNGCTAIDLDNRVSHIRITYNIRVYRAGTFFFTLRMRRYVQAGSEQVGTWNWTFPS